MGILIALSGCSGGWWHDAPAGPQPAITAADSGVVPSQSQFEQPVYGGAPNRYSEQSTQPDYVPPPTTSVRYDNVGVAVWSAEAGTVAGAHPSLPPGSFVEVTSLDTGKTILVPITAVSRPGREIELSGAAAFELGLPAGGGQAPVRVRATNATGADIGALRAGRPAPPRPDTPPVLLNALRRKLNGTIGQAPGAQPPAGYMPPPDATPTIRPMQSAPANTMRPAARQLPPLVRSTAPVSAPGAGYSIELAAFADAGQAQALAARTGAAVTNVRGAFQVRFGPFADIATAQAARDDLAGRGYANARIVRQN